MSKLLFCFLLLLINNAYSQIIIEGCVVDNTQKPIPGVLILDKSKSITVFTNSSGCFKISSVLDSIEISVSIFGYETQQLKIKESAKDLNILLPRSSFLLDSLVIESKITKQDKINNSAQLGTINLNTKDVKYIPTIFGEADLIKVMQLLPGIQSGTEGNNGMFVRGGDADQNLILLNHARIYNAGHILNFVSIFNPEAIDNVTLYKAGFPSNLGGRLSSVIDVTTSESSNSNYKINGGIGLISSRFTLDLPIKNKGGFLISGRRSYIDRIFKLVNSDEESSLPFFYDFNLNFNYKLKKDKVVFNFYNGNDAIISLPNSINFRNTASSIVYNKYLNDKSGIDFILTYSLNHNSIKSNPINEEEFINIKGIIEDFGLKTEYKYSLNNNNKLQFGAEIIQRKIVPNIINTNISEIINSNNLIVRQILQNNKINNFNFHEYSFYGFNKITSTNFLHEINYGIRFSGVILPKKNYFDLEPRINYRYKLSNNQNIKLSYSKMKQYMHQISSTSLILPTDLWYPITEYIKPQTSHQFAIATTYEFKKIKSNITIESFYKTMNNLTEYKEGVNTLFNNDINNIITQGKGEAYGFEFLFRKEEGIFNGWISYTLSWSKRLFEEINNGLPYFSKYDRRHNLSVVNNIKLTKKIHLSTAFIYYTGHRYTVNLFSFLMPNSSLTGVDVNSIPSNRNEYILRPTHRLDINLIYKNEKRKKYHYEWQLGAYNVYNRNNPFILTQNFDSENIVLEQEAFFGFIPSVTFNFKF